MASFTGIYYINLVFFLELILYRYSIKSGNSFRLNRPFGSKCIWFNSIYFICFRKVISFIKKYLFAIGTVFGYLSQRFTFIIFFCFHWKGKLFYIDICQACKAAKNEYIANEFQSLRNKFVVHHLLYFSF